MSTAAGVVAIAFLVAVLGRAAVRLWLGARQISAVEARRSRLPRLFVGRLSLAAHERSAAYALARLRATRVGAVAGAAAALALTFGGGIAALDAWWRASPLEGVALGVAVVLSGLAAMRLIELPFSLWRTFALEARFGVPRRSARLFATDFAKRLAIGGLIAAPLAAGVIALMEFGGEHWWVAAWVGWVAVSLVLTWAWPRVVAPLFNRFTPLDDRVLEARLAGLLARCGLTGRGVLVMRGSPRASQASAYITGIGRNRRIVFADSLLARLAPEEVEAVLAHELGHFRLHHLRWRLVLSALIALVAFGALAWLAGQPQVQQALGVAQAAPQTALLLFVVTAPAFAFFTTPLAAYWSRRQELAADDFAIRHASAGALAGALLKLYRDNAASLVPDRFYSLFYDTHPPALVRIARLRVLPVPEPVQ